MFKKKISRIGIALGVSAVVLSGSIPISSVYAEERIEWGFGQKDSKSESVYLNNQGKLAATSLMQLPVGAVRPENWLENQLLLMKNGLTGHMKEYTNYNYETSEWLNGTSGDSWEKGSYFARGLTAMAYVLDDDELLEEAMQWIMAMIDSQQESGFFGPKSNNDWWARMPALDAVRDFYEGVEAKPEDQRTEKEKEYFGKVIPFFEKYFRYELQELPGRPLDGSWGSARAGDNLEIVYWLYNHLYDKKNPAETDWLLELGELLWDQSVKWDEESHNTTVRHHVVNTSQGLKTAPLYSLYDQDNKRLKTTFAAAIDNIGLDHGRVDGLPNADETPRDNRSDRGTELCGIVEGIVSSGIALEISGEAWIGDYMEKLAYNTLPAAYSGDYSGHSYYVQQNQILSTVGSHEFDQDHGNDVGFGAPGGYECCFPNNHMGWPKFVQNMWMATDTGGLAVTAYGPNNVTARVSGGKTAIFREKTDYPFKDTVQLEYAGDAAEFDLRLRIPEWAKGVSVEVNGNSQDNIVNGEFYTIDRKWEKGDEISVTFKSEVELTTWYNNSTAVQKGPLIYGLKIEEDWRTYDETDIGGAQHTEEQPQREVYPDSPWNYGLVVDKNGTFEVHESEQIAMQPFESDNAPVTITAKGVRVDSWTVDGNNAGAQPYGPVRYNEGEMEEITLIPFGCGRLRITQFPTMDNQKATDKVVREESKTIKRNGVVYQDFDNIVVPKADDYVLRITAEGTGKVIINSKYVQDVSGNTTIEGLKELKGLNGYFQFKEEIFNNIRFCGDIKVSKIEIEALEKDMNEIQIITASRDGNSAKIVTNLLPQEVPYEVTYGTETGNYTETAAGFTTNTASLYNLDENQDYFAKIRAVINGEQRESQEVILKTADDSGDIALNPNVPEAEYEGFGNVKQMEEDWKLFDPNNKIHIQDNGGKSQIRVEKNEDVKAVLDAKGSESWVDYVAETEIVLDDGKENNAGLMFRSTNNGTGPNGFTGYYFGVGTAGAQKGMRIGYGYINDFAVLADIPMEISANHPYKLKVIAYGEMMAFYLDDQLITVLEDARYSNGTVGVRSYNEAFTANDVTVRSLQDSDLDVFREYLKDKEGEEEIVVHPEHNKAAYEGFGSTAEETQEDFSFYDPDQKIHVENDGTISFGEGEKVKAVLAADNPDEWIDYAVEAKLSVNEVKTNNCGIIFRADPQSVGDNPDEFRGYFAGIGKINTNVPGLIVGYADGGWHDIVRIDCDIQPGQEYTLKAVAYDNQFAIYLNNQKMYQFEDDRYTAGVVGLRSYCEAFKVKDMTVRGLTQNDLVVFGGEPDNVPELKDDFENGNINNWNMIGDTANVNIENGQMNFGYSQDVKAVVGDENWTDMVYSADIELGEGSGNSNAGLIFRVTGEQGGPDGYNGYYFGISFDECCIGKADGAWHPLDRRPMEIGEGIHNLKVIASENLLLCYLDGKQISVIQDSDYANGKVGFRSYNRAFSADNVEVRGLNEEEKEIVRDIRENGRQIQITAVSSDEMIQVKYPNVSGADFYRIVYGTQSGQYTNSFTDIKNRNFTADKAGISVENGTYYMKVYAMKGKEVLAQSNEIEITTGQKASIDVDKTKLTAKMSEAGQIDTSGFSEVSKLRMNAAKAYGQYLLEKQDANQNELAIGVDLLAISMQNPDTEYAGWIEQEPENPDTGNPDAGNPSQPSTGEDENGQGDGKTHRAVKTGDTKNASAAGVILLVTTGVIVVYYKKRLKNK